MRVPLILSELSPTATEATSFITMAPVFSCPVDLRAQIKGRNIEKYAYLIA
jgi:hypothetical protein